MSQLKNYEQIHLKYIIGITCEPFKDSGSKKHLTKL